MLYTEQYDNVQLGRTAWADSLYVIIVINVYFLYVYYFAHCWPTTMMFAHAFKHAVLSGEKTHLHSAWGLITIFSLEQLK